MYLQVSDAHVTFNLHRIFKSLKRKYIDNYLFQLKSLGSGELCGSRATRISGLSKYIYNEDDVSTLRNLLAVFN